MLRALAYSIFFLFLPQANFAEDILDTDELFHISIVEVSGEVTKYTGPESKQSVLIGGHLEQGNYLETKDKSYIQLLLSDNSLIQIGANSIVQVKNDKNGDFYLHKGKLRVLSYKNKKVIETPWGPTELTKGEFLWDVFEEKGKLKVEIDPFSGSLVIGEKIFEPKEYVAKPEATILNATHFARPWVVYFGEIDQSKSYVGRVKMRFNERKLASIEEAEIAEFSEDLQDEQASLKDMKFEKVKGDIWVHDIVYDEAVRAIEKAAFKKAKQIVPFSVKEAADNLVWEVARKSVFKWGAKFARIASDGQVQQSVEGSVNEEEVVSSSYYDKERFLDSTERIANLRAYRISKVAWVKGGYEKGWREAKEYALKMMEPIVVPVLRGEVYEYSKEAGNKAVDEVLKKSQLVKTPDVDKLVEHLSQVAADKIIKRLVSQYAPFYTERAAKIAAKQVAESTAEDVARYMAEDASEKAGELLLKNMAKTRASSLARGLASESKEEEARTYGQKSRKKQVSKYR